MQAVACGMCPPLGMQQPCMPHVVLQMVGCVCVLVRPGARGGKVGGSSALQRRL